MMVRTLVLAVVFWAAPVDADDLVEPSGLEEPSGTGWQAHRDRTCTGRIKANKFFPVETLDFLKESMPCGRTSPEYPACLRDTDEGCAFGIGDRWDANWILVEWLIDADTGRFVSASKCNELADVVGPCTTVLPVGCPDPIASSGDETCPPFCVGDCAPFCSGISRSPGVSWDVPCRAYALMPEGADAGDPALAYFVPGKIFPGDGLAWQDPREEGRFTALQALVEGLLGPSVLGLAGGAEVWGVGDGGVSPRLFEELREHLCIEGDRVLFASPHWQMEGDRGVRSAPLLTVRDGEGRCQSAVYDYYLAEHRKGGDRMSAADWSSAGADLEDVVNALTIVAEKRGEKLVCITSAVADRQRTAWIERNPRQ